MSKYDFELDMDNKNSLSVIANIVKPNSLVLEFGPANGRLTKYLKNIGCTVDIVEIDSDAGEQAAKFARNSFLGNENGDIEKFYWLEKLSNQSYDFIIFADVLEHLYDPERVLEKSKSLLRDDGKIIISIPNIAHNSIIINLFYDNFNYTETGLLDNTHIRFWGLNNLELMCNKLGYVITQIDTINVIPEYTEQGEFFPKEYLAITDLLRNRPNGDVYQFVSQLEKNKNRSTKYKNIITDQKMPMNIYLDTGSGYNENEKITDTIELGITQNKRYNLEDFSNVQRIRLDLVEGIFCKIEIIDIKLNDKIADCFPVNAFFVEECGAVFCNLDPAFEIVNEIKHNNIIEIQFIVNKIPLSQIIDKAKNIFLEKEQLIDNVVNENYRSLEKYQRSQEELLYTEEKLSLTLEELFLVKDQMNDIIDQNKNALEQYYETKNQLECILQSASWKVTKPIRAILDKIKAGVKNHTSVFKIINNPIVLKNLKNVDSLLQDKTGKLYTKFFLKVKVRLKYNMIQDTISNINIDEDFSMEEYCIGGEFVSQNSETPMVSVIVPNYNHSAYLEERLDSIYAQTYRNFEVILLDDCSTDESVTILSRYAERYKKNTRLLPNTENSGSPFKQWEKGILEAKGEYIWIAESDDYCSDNFLEKLLPFLSNQSVSIAFARSVFMQDDTEIWNTEQYLNDIKGFSWDKEFTMTASTIVKHAFVFKNVIPNVSSALFRNIGKFPQDVKDLCRKLKLCGDWLFYLSIIKGGCVSYTNKTTNYYRIHKESTSLKIQKTVQYYKEHEIISKYIASNYIVNGESFAKVLLDLKEHYRTINTSNTSIVEQNYSLDTIKECMQLRKRSVLICTFSMEMGGGETFPLYLANEMRANGENVAVLDFNMSLYDESVRKMLNPDVPLIQISNVNQLGRILYLLDGDVIHSHHASVDNLIALWLNGNKMLNYKHIISLHGMYEAIEKEDLEYILNNVNRSCAHFVYTADKNLQTFMKYDIYENTRFSQIGNGLPRTSINRVDRAKLGIKEEDFVLCLVSRAIFEKGWMEAVEAVKIANEKSLRKVQLIMIGEGEAHKCLQNDCPDYVHLLGNKSNIRDYFALSDMGFLPSRFKGESFPLVVIDCLFAGRPVIASDIGEIRKQLTDSEGNVAGSLFKLEDFTISVDLLANIIVELATNKSKYNEVLKSVDKVVEKFDIKHVADQYLKVYENFN